MAMEFFEARVRLVIGIGDTVKLRNGSVKTIKSVDILSFNSKLDYPVFVIFEGLDNLYSYNFHGRIADSREDQMDIVAVCGRPVYVKFEVCSDEE